MKLHIKMGTIVKWGTIMSPTEKAYFNKNIDIDKTVAPNKVFTPKNKIFNVSFAAKILNFCTYLFQKWVHIEEVLMKLDICLF